ncbi:MAG: helix-turn-helix domain-containing protein, partial [Peptococcaceae bacterium]|nr:helix-turn-helix domain-containing protein [Peptococcaceae bacterium]
MDYISVKQASERWGLSDRRVRVLCEQEKISGVIKKGRSYLIPANAIKPADGRAWRGVNIPKEYVTLIGRVDALKADLDKRRPLTQGELARLQEEFLVEFTY